MEIIIKKLGLAAFIKTRSEDDKSTKFVRYQEGVNGGFIFESTKNSNDWKVEYMNSECSRFDKNLMEMREFLK